MQFTYRRWPARRTPGFLGGLLVLVGVVVTFVFLAVLAALGLVLMVLVATAIAAERLLAALVPAYRHRRRGRYVTMPTTLRTMVWFTPGRSEPIEAHTLESPSGPGRSEPIEAHVIELPSGQH